MRISDWSSDVCSSDLATYEIDGETTDFRISGFYVRTDRSETERSFEYDDPTAITGPLPAGNLISDNSNVNEIDQESYSIDAKLSHEWTLGKTALKDGFARFDDKPRETEKQNNFDVDYDEAEGKNERAAGGERE